MFGKARRHPVDAEHQQVRLLPDQQVSKAPRRRLHVTGVYSSYSLSPSNSLTAARMCCIGFRGGIRGRRGIQGTAVIVEEATGLIQQLQQRSRVRVPQALRQNEKVAAFF